MDQQILSLIPSSTFFYSQKRTLYFLFSGYNDYFFNYYFQRNDIQPEQVVSSILNNIRFLINDFKSRRIFVFNLGAMEKTPFAKSLPEEIKSIFQNITKTHNELLKIQVDILLKQRQTDQESLSIEIIDYSSLFNYILENPMHYGIKEVDIPCVNPQTNIICSDPDSYFFWDIYHVTSKIHQSIAVMAFSQIQKFLD